MKYSVYSLQFGSDVYIGRTKNYNFRIKSHRYNTHVPSLRKYIKLYGWKNVIVRRLASNLSENESILQERFFIKTMGSNAVNKNKFTVTSYELETVKVMISCNLKNKEISKRTGVPTMIIANIRRAHGYR